ncbi:MAG: transposase [Anaerolineaceae bacterium]|nr:transposase [Anaerolineaceae bacterium]
MIIPNHVHAIIVLIDKDDFNIENSIGTGAVGGGFKPPPTLDGNDVRSDSTIPPHAKRYPLSEIVRAFKTFSAKQINQLLNTPVWQRNYYEHIIRNEQEYEKIAHYIEHNPLNWLEDEEYFLD